MGIEQPTQHQDEDPQDGSHEQKPESEHEGAAASNDVDGLKDKKPEDLTPEELRLMADTMPGEGPGD